MSGLYTITLFFSGMLLAATTNGQSIREVKVSLEWEEAPLARVFSGIEEATDFRFIKDDKLLAKRTDRVSLKVEEQTLAFVLREVSRQTGLSFKQLDGTIMVHTPDQKTVQEKPEEKLPVQGRVVSGKVTDEDGEPLPGVNVIVKGTTRGTVTDVAGNYSIEVAEQELLVFSYVGFRITEEAIAGRSVIDVTMEVDAQSLQELVVNAGYWEVTKEKQTGNIAQVTAKEIAQQPVANPLQSIQGRMAGVVVTQSTGVPGGDFDIQIRGQNSLRTTGADNGNFPLYVVDGVPFPAIALGPSPIGGQIIRGGNPLNGVNPQDIESIEILKDADATAIYGSRGANGVVLIRTKNAGTGKTQVDVNLYSGIGEVSRKMDLLNTQQYLEMRKEAFANDDAEPGDRFPDNDLLLWDTTRFTDWQEELLGGRSNVTNGQISISGGNQQTKYLISTGYYRETTVYPGDFSYNRIANRFNVNHSSSNQRFNISFTGNYTVENNNLPRADLASAALFLPPIAPAPFDSLGKVNWENSTWDNPYAALEQEYDSRNTTLLGNLDLGYFILDGLLLKANIGYTELTFNEEAIFPERSFDPADFIVASSSFGDRQHRTWIVEPQLQYQKHIGPGKLNVLIGSTFQSTSIRSENISAQGFSSDALLSNPQAASVITVNFFDESLYKYNGTFARLNYDFRDKYIINLTARRDGSSRFGQGQRFGNFGAVGAAWIFSNESFIQSNLPFLNFGKIRASYGTTGSDQIPNYGYLELWDLTQPYNGTASLIPNNLSNEDFAWEVNRKLEFGLELGLWGNRLFLSTSYYRNRSDNQLVGIPTPATTGFLSLDANWAAEVENKGWEFELNTTNLIVNDFRWSSSLNLTIPRNELISFPNIEETAFDSQYEVGKSLFVEKDLHFLGVNPQTGVYDFEDVNGDDRISTTDDIRALKEVRQDFFGGFQNTFSYKGLELSFLIQFVSQTGLNYLNYFERPGTVANQPTYVLNRWQQPGDITDIQRYSQGLGDARNAYRNAINGDGRIGDASFIRLENVSLSYGLPTDWLENLHIQNARFYVQGQNLLTITDYKGLDPENQRASLPPLRMLTGGIQLTF